MTDNAKNPWKGWTSYEESDLILDKDGEPRYKFVGREKEIDSLYTLICNSPLTTIYGRSGIGKTSLLQAGVFPLLRMTGFVPVVCRFDGVSDCSDIIIKAIESACSVERLREGENANLVDFFLNSKFTKDGEDVTPVVVLDQFEDLLKQGSESYSPLLSQIHALVFDDSSTDIEINFRFVISIREDFLYLLEDAVDIAGYTEFKENRYRLLPMREESADKIIGLLKGIPDSVRERLKALALKDGNYTPALLSFYCHELYEATGGDINESSLALLENESKLISRYYDALFSKGGISRTSRRYIEENLQKNGMRSSVKQEAAEKNIPEFKKLIANDSHKLLQTFRAGDDTHVELIHDKVAEIIQENRNATDNRRWRIMFRIIVAIITVFLLFTSVYFFINNIYAENNITLSNQIATIDSDFGSPFVRTLTIPNEYDFNHNTLFFNKSKYNNLGRIIISEGCDSIWLFEIQDYTTIVIPASLSFLTINEDAKNLHFEVDENNPTIKLYDEALWKVYPEYDKKDELIWAPSDKKYICFPPDKRKGNSVRERISCYWGNKYYKNRNNHVEAYIVTDSSQYIARVELTNTDKTVDLSNDSSLRGRIITKISNLEYVETLILPRGCRIIEEAIVNAPNLRKVVVSEDVTLCEKSFVYCPSLSRVELASTVKFHRTTVPVFLFCPPIDFKIEEGAPFSFSKGVLKSKEYPYLIHSNVNELQPELFREEIESGKMNYRNNRLTALNKGNSTVFYDAESWSLLVNNQLCLGPNILSLMRSDLIGLTDIHLIKSFSPDSRSNCNNFLSFIPKEIRRKITLHIPNGTSMEFLNVPEAFYFKEVVEESFSETARNVFRMQIISMARAWKENLFVVILVIFASVILIILIPPIRRNIIKCIIYIPIWLLLFYGLYWTIFNLTPPRWVYNIYVQIAEAVGSGIVSLTATIWLVTCNRHSFDPLKIMFEQSRQYIEKKSRPTINKVYSFLESDILRYRKPAVAIMLIIVIAVIAFEIVTEMRARIDRDLNSCAALIKKSDYDSAVERLPVPNIFFSSRQTAMLDSLASLLTEEIQPEAPFTIIEETWKPDGIQNYVFSSDRRLLAVNDDCGHIVIYDWNSKTPKMAFDIPFSYRVRSLDFNNDGSKLLLNGNGRLVLVNIYDKTASFIENVPHSFDGGAVFINDSTIIGKHDFKLYHYDLVTKEEIEGTETSVNSWVISPSHEILSALTGNHKLVVMSTKDLSVISSMQSPDSIYYGEIAFNSFSDTIVIKGDSTAYRIPVANPDNITILGNSDVGRISCFDKSEIAETLSIKDDYRLMYIAEFDGKIYKKQSSYFTEFWKGVFSDDSIMIPERPFRDFDQLPNRDYYIPRYWASSLPKGCVYNIRTETPLQLDSMRIIRDISLSGQRVLYSSNGKDTVYLEDIHGKDSFAIPIKHRNGCIFIGSDHRIAISSGDSIFVYCDSIRTDAIQGRAVCSDSNGRYLLAYVNDKLCNWGDVLAVLDAKTLKPLIFCGSTYDEALFTESGELFVSSSRRIHRYKIPTTLAERVKLLKKRSDIKVYIPDVKKD